MFKWRTEDKIKQKEKSKSKPKPKIKSFIQTKNWELLPREIQEQILCESLTIDNFPEIYQIIGFILRKSH